MIVITDNENSTRLQAIIDHLLSIYPREIQQRIESTNIFVTDDLNVPDLDDPIQSKLLKRSYSEGFGCVVNNYIYSNLKGHLVVINLTLADQLQLSELEITAALAHELGHIFNNPTPRTLPSILNGASKEEIDEVKGLNDLDKELYADHFAKVVGLESDLISSFDKYTTWPDAKNVGMFESRKEALRSNAIFEGSEKQLR